MAVLPAGPGLAAVDLPVYQATVSLGGTTVENERIAAYAEALRVVAVRASGRRSAAESPAVAAATAKAADYVQQYASLPGRNLRVSFDGRAVEQLLAQAGLPVWPAERPVTLVVLVPPGAARAIAESERPAARIELEDAAQRRGLPVAWPGQAIDVATAVAAVESTDPAAARALALAHGAEMLLVGTSGATDIEWRFSLGGRSSRSSGAAGDGAHLAADQLALWYAPPSTRSVNSVPLTVGGIERLESYVQLLRYLGALSPVRSVAVDGLAADRLRLRIAMRGDLELLRRLAALDSHLAPVAGVAADPAAPAVDFTYVP